jgi:L-ornithine N5-oxygenase
MHRTNYSGLAPDMLDTLYRQVYLEKLTGRERLGMLPMTEVIDARMDGAEVVLSIMDRMSGTASELRCDRVLLGTGFVKEMPRMVRELAEAVGLADITVTRGYGMQLPPGSTATCHLQGVNEATHGIADSLLSVLASRSEDIVTDILARRTAAWALKPIPLPR